LGDAGSGTTSWGGLARLSMPPCLKNQRSAFQ
jgi:hypothetical protein